MFLVNQGSQIKAFVDSVLDGVEQIAAGAGSAVSGLIEKALAQSLPMVIGFLASLLGLGGISEKIKEILQKVQEPVGKVIDSIIGTVVRIGKGLWNKFTGKDGDSEKSKAVKKKAEDMLTGPTAGQFDSKEDLDKVVGNVLTTLQPEGLKTLTTVPERKDPSRFNIVATASPAKKVGTGNVVGGGSPAEIAEAKKFLTGTTRFKVVSTGRIARVTEVTDATGWVILTYDNERTIGGTSQTMEGKPGFAVKVFLDNVRNGGPQLVDAGGGPGATTWTLNGKDLRPEYNAVRTVFYASPGGDFASALPAPSAPFTCPGWPKHKDPAKRVPHTAAPGEWSVDHRRSVAGDWNNSGRKADQAARNKFWTEASNLVGMCGSCNSSKGSADLLTGKRENYQKQVAIPGFKGPDGTE
jgi:hypothetical protein